MITNHTEPVEIRFSSYRRKDKWQLLVSVTASGTLNYRLERVPQGNYSHSMSTLVGKTERFMPMKAYDGWQDDLIAWLTDLSLSGDPIYKVEEIL